MVIDFGDSIKRFLADKRSFGGQKYISLFADANKIRYVSGLGVLENIHNTQKGDCCHWFCKVTTNYSEKRLIYTSQWYAIVVIGDHPVGWLCFETIFVLN